MKHLHLLQHAFMKTNQNCASKFKNYISDIFQNISDKSDPITVSFSKKSPIILHILTGTSSFLRAMHIMVNSLWSVANGYGF